MQGNMSKSTSTTSWTMGKVIALAVPLILLAVNTSFAAPANSNEDQIGFAPVARQVFRSQGNPTLADYNLVSVVPDSGIQSENVDNQQNVEALLKYLFERNSYITNRLRSYPMMDSARNELARKRSSYSRSRYCAFNAVSCFGRKK